MSVGSDDEFRDFMRGSDPDAYVRAIVIHENSKRFRKQRVREDLRAAVPECGTGADDGLADRASPRPRPKPSPRN